MSTQNSLFNIQTLTSTKTMRAHIAKARASSLSASTKTTDGKLPADTADPLAPSSLPWKWSSPVKQVELHIPDEERVLTELKPESMRCPECKSMFPKLHRTKYGYFVECRLISCCHRTETCSTSQEAIHLWKLVNALSK